MKGPSVLFLNTHTLYLCNNHTFYVLPYLPLVPDSYIYFPSNSPTFILSVSSHSVFLATPYQKKKSCYVSEPGFFQLIQWSPLLPTSWVYSLRWSKTSPLCVGYYGFFTLPFVGGPLADSVIRPLYCNKHQHADASIVSWQRVGRVCSDAYNCLLCKLYFQV